MIVKLVSKYEADDYDDFLESQSQVFITQSQGWADVQPGWSVLHFIALATAGGEVLGTCQVMYNTDGDTAIYHAARGPIVSYKADHSLVAFALIKTIVSTIAKNTDKEAVLYVDPAWENTDDNMELVDDIASRLNGTVYRYPDDFYAWPHFTMQQNIKGLEPDEWPRTLAVPQRNSLREALEAGARSFTSRDEKYLDDMNRFMRDDPDQRCAKHHDPDYYQRILRAFPDAFLAIGAYRHEVLSVSVNVPYRDTVFSLHSATSLAHPELQMGLVMSREIFFAACRRYATYVDLCGVMHPDEKCPHYEFKSMLTGEHGLIAYAGQLSIPISPGKLPRRH